MREINYVELLNEIKEKLNKMKEIVVATCYKQRITARIVNCVCDGVNIYFITSKAYTKYKQIIKNPNVALAVNNIQIEGVAKVLGHPSVDENEHFISICRQDKDYYDYYNKYSNYKNSVLIKVKPNLITVYKGRGCYHYLNLVLEKGYKKGNN